MVISRTAVQLFRRRRRGRGDGNKRRTGRAEIGYVRRPTEFHFEIPVARRFNGRVKTIPRGSRSTVGGQVKSTWRLDFFRNRPTPPPSPPITPLTFAAARRTIDYANGNDRTDL